MQIGKIRFAQNLIELFNTGRFTLGCLAFRIKLVYIKNIDNKNPSLVMCRNMWPYINSSEYDGYAEALYEKLAPGSVVVIGFFDYTADYSDKIFLTA